ncbi:MAG: hypothetical protein ACC726_05575 [Chloroflexota bacterium]
MDIDKLRGVWFHSREEDQGDRVVYRGRSYPFPPSRSARDSFTFREDGMVEVGRPGPGDASESTPAVWVVEDRLLTVSMAGREDVFVIESADEEMLVLRRQRSKEVGNGQQE